MVPRARRLCGRDRNSQRMPGPVRLGDRPVAAIDAHNLSRCSTRQRPGRTGNACSAAHVEDGNVPGQLAANRAEDMTEQHEVHRAVVERERGALARSIERRTAGDPPRRST